MGSRQKRLPRHVREQQMLDAAIQVFSRAGYHTASVDEIAETAGISKPMVYIYLGSKERLFTACIHREAERLVEAIRAVVSPQDPPELGLWEGLQAFFRFVADNRESWAVLYQQARTQGEPFSTEVGQARQRVMEEITALVVAGTKLPGGERIISAKDAEILARMVAGAADALTEWLLEHPEESADTLAQRVMSLALVGVERYTTGDLTGDTEASADTAVDTRAEPTAPVRP